MKEKMTDASFMKTSGMSNEQLNDFALVSKIRKWRAEIDSKELIKPAEITVVWDL